MFYLHEDDWGMIAVMPVENLKRAGEVAQEAEEFGEAHRAPDGVGWTDVYVVPEEFPISARGIRLEELREVIGGGLVEAEGVQSGYSSYVEVIKNAFAFREGDGKPGALYGNVKDGLVTGLYVLRPDWEEEGSVAWFERVLGELGERWGLMVADWWWDMTVDLRDGEAVGKWLRNDA